VRAVPPMAAVLAIARHMNVDPSLIRYYYRDRSTLLRIAMDQDFDERILRRLQGA
jgi:AcrR family transcriptional regulator